LPPIQGIVSAASGLQGTFAAGEIVVIYVSGFGPANVTTPPPGSTSVPTSLAGTRVFFNGIAAPILYTGSTQICAIVPYNFLFLVSPGNTNPTAPKTFPVAVQVVYGNLQTATLSVTITNASPGVFTLSQNGAGPAAALNQDGSINGRANPAAPGTTIVFFATGEGQTAPAGVDGKLAVAPYPQPLASVGVTIGGLPATVLYAGGAPGEVAGVMQVNAVVPPGLTANSAAALQLNIGSAVSQTGVTVAVSGN
jgi:uncharacterized protein (TIGR03437 family)